MNEPIAIIGIGCMFPKANGLAAFWSNIREGVDAVSDVPPTHWRPEDYYNPEPWLRIIPTAGEAPSWIASTSIPETGIAPRDIEATDTSQLFGLAVAKQALEDAEYGAGGKSFRSGAHQRHPGRHGRARAGDPAGREAGSPHLAQGPR